MKLVSALAEIGAAVPSVLDKLLSCDAATALETVRRAACTGANVVLEAPPPAMLHPSKYPASNILYCGRKQSPVADAAYSTTDPEFDTMQHDGSCVGPVMFDVCKGMSRPAVVYAEAAEGQPKRIHVYVHNAPLGAMEAELYDGNGLPSGFEAKWLGDQAKAAKELRHEVGAWVRKQGYDRMQPYMHDKKHRLCLIRPGVLPFLRMRSANTEEETELLMEALRARRLPKEGWMQLKDFIATCEEDSVELFTTFVAGAVEAHDPNNNCSNTSKNAVIGSLALAVLKYAKDDDYYGVEMEDEESEDKCEEDEGEEAEAKGEEDLQTIVDNVMLREVDRELLKEGPALSYRRDNILMRLIGPTLRACDSKLIVNAQSDAGAVSALADAAFCDADALIIKRTLVGQSFNELCDKMISGMDPRCAFLMMTKEEDGSLRCVLLLTHQGVTQVRYDSVTRYVLCPWVIPFVLDGMTVVEIKVQGVQREQFRLTEAKRTEALYERQDRQSAIPDEIVQFIRQASEGLQSIPALAARVATLEAQLQTGVSVASGSAVSTPPVREMSETQRGFKRMVAQIEAYNAAVERNTRAR